MADPDFDKVDVRTRTKGDVEVGHLNAGNSRVNPATEETLAAVLAAIGDLSATLTTEVDTLQAALLQALSDVEAEITLQGDETQAEVLAAKAAIVAAIQALEASGDTNSANVVAAVQAAQAALEAALGDVETAIDTAASTLDATIISEGDQTQAILTNLLTNLLLLLALQNNPDRNAGILNDLGPGLRLRALGADATPFGEQPMAFRDLLFDAVFQEEQDEGNAPSDLKMKDGTPVTITPLGSGASPGYTTYDDGHLVLGTGTDTDGGIILDIGPCQYRSAIMMEVFLTVHLLQDLPADVEVRVGWGSGTLDENNPSLPGAEDAQGVRQQGSNLFAMYRNGSTGENRDVPEANWNGTIGGPNNELKRQDGTPITYTLRKRQLKHIDYAYLGAIPGEVETNSPNREWPRMHRHEWVALEEGRNFKRASQNLRLVIRKTGGADSTDYKVRFASMSISRTGSPMQQGVVLTAQGRRIGQVNEGEVEIPFEGVTADQELLPIPSNLRFRLTDIMVAGENTSTLASFLGGLRDGGAGAAFPLKAPFGIEEATGGLGGINTVGNIRDHMSAASPFFDVSVFFDVFQGAPNIYGVLLGYWEKRPAA